MRLHIDFETRSAVDLKTAGVDRYCEDPSTGVWCMSYRFGDDPVEVWLRGQPFPVSVADHIARTGTVVAHNARFERTVWNKVLRREVSTDLPTLEIRQQDCTMARAAARGLPQALGMLASVLKVPVQKDAEGAKLMLKMCRPRSIQPDGTIVWWDQPENLARLAQYCMTDVLAECEIDAVLAPLSETEREAWILDQTINDRGVALDVFTARMAHAVAQEARRRADARMWLLTDGQVQKTSETAKIVRWLNARGVPCESVAKGEIEELVLKSQVVGEPVAEEVIRLRQTTAKTSVDKFKAMQRSVSADGRGRGYLAYHAAATGRWAGRLIQPQNLPRVDHDRDYPDVEKVIQILGWGLPVGDACDAIEMLTGDVMGTLSKCLRAALVAGPNKRFVGGDFSNIEGRINAWISGEHWKLDAFRAFDEKRGPDLYLLAYSTSFGVEVGAVTKDQRQIGKVQELACGYQGSVGAFTAMGRNYGLHVEEARALEIVRAWRAANPAITQSWWDLQDAAIEAVNMPGQICEACYIPVKYVAVNGFLFCRLPSGRVIAYADPKLVERETKSGRKAWGVEYWGIDQITGRWSPQSLYGGLQSNNVVQGTARDIMLEAMFRAEQRGYPVVLTVHDELLCEVSSGSATILREIMSELPAWAEGLPLAAAAWEDTRYVK